MAGIGIAGALVGNEVLFVQGVTPNGSLSSVAEQTTTGAIAALAATEATPTVETVISTVGNGTLTAAALVGGQINRSGPTSAFTDTTDTAANVIAALPGFAVGIQFYVVFKNATIYPQTIAAGAGVTLPGTVLVPGLSESNYFVTLGGTSGSPTVSFTHVGTTPIHTPGSISAPLATALATVGAGTITAAGIYGGITTRSGTQIAAFTDTTDTAAAIIALLNAGSAIVGQSAYYTYVNNTTFPATIAGGTGVTITGATVVPANSWIRYVVTFTGTGAITLLANEQGYFPSSGTYINNGATSVTVANAAVTGGSIISFTLKTVGGTVSASAPNVKTITPGTGFTVAGLASDTSTYNYEIRG